MKKTLIIGGTSGLGLELAKLEQERGVVVYITGRRKPDILNLNFIKLDINANSNYVTEVDTVVSQIGPIDTVVYAAGFFQDGTITDITWEDVVQMMNVGIMAALRVTKRILELQGELDEFIAITSTSQWTPRLYEPVYTAAKAALGAFANSLSLDERVKKTIVVGPAGMDTRFWEGSDPVAHDASKMLKPYWVAQEIQKLRDQRKSYLFAKILREPARVEIVDIR